MDVDTGLTKHRTEGSFGHVSGMAWQGDLAAGSHVTPNFVASGSGPIEPVAEPSQPTCDLPVPETGKTPHLRHADGHEQVDAGIGFD